MLDIDCGQFLAGWTVTDVWNVSSNDEKAICSLMDDVLVGDLIRARRTSLSRSSSARRAGQLEEGRRQVELEGLARRRPTCKPDHGWTGTACPSTCRGPSSLADSPSPLCEFQASACFNLCHAYSSQALRSGRVLTTLAPST